MHQTDTNLSATLTRNFNWSWVDRRCCKCLRFVTLFSRELNQHCSGPRPRSAIQTYAWSVRQHSWYPTSQFKLLFARHLTLEAPELEEKFDRTIFWSRVHPQVSGWRSEVHLIRRPANESISMRTNVSIVQLFAMWFWLNSHRDIHEDRRWTLLLLLLTLTVIL